jgi:uncharacterized protein YggE
MSSAEQERMKPDTMTIRVVREAELDADSADLVVVVEGTSVFSGNEAFKKAVELRKLVEALNEVGVSEGQVKLRSVEITSQSFALVKSSSAKYVVTIKKVPLETLPAALGVIASHKGAKTSRLSWNYGELKQTRRQLRNSALADALEQAKEDAKLLGVTVLGVYQLLAEGGASKEHNTEYIAGDSASVMRARSAASPEPIALQLGNSTTVSVDLKVEFRISGLPTESAGATKEG